ncbi:MAG: energy-coupled thiamine transporter ThiT [Ruminiclostridium sp.]|nr:energy-coupled thiamine transporter ThiT [Ruminiclostridium sp.]
MEKTNKKISVSQLVTSAILLALAMVLSMIKVYKLPLGGSVTLLSMLPVCMISLKYGVKWGFVCSFLYAFIQFGVDLGEVMAWGMDVRMWIGCIVFDYMLAYGILGLSGIFRKRKTPVMLTGVGIAVAIRFISHYISGAIFFDIWMPEQFDNPYFYSLVYNGSYMLPELIFTLIGAGLLFGVPVIRKIISTDDI